MPNFFVEKRSKPKTLSATLSQQSHIHNPYITECLSTPSDAIPRRNHSNPIRYAMPCAFTHTHMQSGHGREHVVVLLPPPSSCHVLHNRHALVRPRLRSRLAAWQWLRDIAGSCGSTTIFVSWLTPSIRPQRILTNARSMNKIKKAYKREDFVFIFFLDICPLFYIAYSAYL